MKIKILIIAFSGIVNFQLNSQTDCDCYERLENLSDYYSAIGEDEQSLRVFKEALKYKDELDWHNWDYRQLGIKSIKSKEFSAGQRYLAKAISMGYEIEYLEENKDLAEFRESDDWSNLMAKKEAYRRKYQSNLNMAYFLRIEYLKGIDQSLRKKSYREIMPDSLSITIDSLNWLSVKEMIKKFGYPSQRTDGFMGWKLSIFFLHASMYSEGINNEIISILSNAQKKCLCRKKAIAQLIDRRLDWKKKKPQLFGLWNSWKDKGKYSKISDIEKLDSRRFELNLLRLKEQSKIDKRAIPTEYKEIKYPKDYFCGWEFRTKKKTE